MIVILQDDERRSPEGESSHPEGEGWIMILTIKHRDPQQPKTDTRVNLPGSLREYIEVLEIVEVCLNDEWSVVNAVVSNPNGIQHILRGEKE